MAEPRAPFVRGLRRVGPDSPAVSNQVKATPRYDCPSPSPKEVLEVKALLLEKLPLEIVDAIIEYAEFWPCISVCTGGRTTIASNFEDSDVLVLRTFPLGYYPPTNDDSLLRIPHENYLVKANGAHALKSPDTPQTVTSNVLSQWKTQSIPRIESPFRKVVFTIKSRDQGWGSDRLPHHGIYEHSWSWFDVGLERFEAIDMAGRTLKNSLPEGFIEQLRLESGDETRRIPTSIACDFLPTLPTITNDPSSILGYEYDHPRQPPGTRLQSNRTANSQIMEHVITWRSDDCIAPYSSAATQLEIKGRGRWTGNGDFVRSLKFGDIISVWARCRYAGWANQVEGLKIDVYWVV